MPEKMEPDVPKAEGKLIDTADVHNEQTARAVLASVAPLVTNETNKTKMKTDSTLRRLMADDEKTKQKASPERMAA